MSGKTIQKFEHAMLKVWFIGGDKSRNLAGVLEIERDGNVLIVRNNSQTTYLLNWDNINMIEEVHIGE